ncbi:MAG: hypothetical protein GYA47_05640, partial [Desulfovibrio sp.]|nr:hypothetical protein [Desulfovibrio sp.]
MANRPFLLCALLCAALTLFGAGCAKYPAYEINVAYINDDLLAQEQTMALEQLRQTRTRYAEALRGGSGASARTVKKEYDAARQKYIVIRKEQERRKGRTLSFREISDDPELAEPKPATASPRAGGQAAPAPKTPETPAEPSSSRPATTAPAVAAGPVTPPPSRPSPSEPAIAPPSAASAPNTPADGHADQAANESAASTYTVAKGDTLGKIAK